MNLQATIAAVVIASVAAAGCSDPVEPLQVPYGVHATVEGTDVVVTNGLRTPIFFFVLPRIGMASIDYMVCADPIRCDPLRTGEVGRSSVTAGMFHGEEEVVVLLWKARRTEDRKWEPDWLPSIVLRINN